MYKFYDMRTKKECLEHLHHNGYKADARAKIAGFLIGMGRKGVDEEIGIKIGEGTFDDFFEWFTMPPVVETYLSLLADVRDRLNKAKNTKEKTKYSSQLAFLNNLEFVNEE